MHCVEGLRIGQGLFEFVVRMAPPSPLLFGMCELVHHNSDKGAY